MLEHVALNQTRFHTPGVAPDARGVLLGKMGAMLLPAIDKLVGFFSILSDDLPLDDLLPTLRIVEVRTPLKSREFLVLLHASSSYVLDRAARVSRMLGGMAFTGTSKHFVKYRDESSPLGYDVDQLSSEGADFLLYSDGFIHACARVREMAFAQLALRLSLRAVPGGRDEPTDREVLWLTVERGLAASVITYLWRNRVQAAATLVEQSGEGLAFGGRGGYLLVRVTQLPERMLRLFRQVPGIAVYRPLGENFVVELGYRHPIRLESCQLIFDKDRFYVFSGRRDQVDILVGPPPLVQGERLLTVGFALGARTPAEDAPPARASAPARVEVELKLVPSAQAGGRVTATLVPWERSAWLKRLVFALPPTVLAGYRVAPIEEGLLVLGAHGVDGLPIGELLQEVAPSIYIPVAMEFLPRVSEAVLTDHVGGTAGRVVVFRRGAPHAVAVADDSFEPLGRRVLGGLEVDLRERSPRLPPRAPAAPAELRNEPVGPLPLWGFRGGPAPDVDS